VVGVVDDEDFVVGAHGASLGFELDVVGVVPARVVQQALRHAEHLLERAAEHRFDSTGDLRGETGAADLKEPQCGRGGVAAGGHGVDPALNDGRHGGGGRHSLGCHQGQHLVGIRGAGQHDAAAVHEGAQDPGTGQREVVPGGKCHRVDGVTVEAADFGAAPRVVLVVVVGAQHPSIVPIPGTRRITRIEENTGATQLPLSADELADLNELARHVGVQGDRYNEHHMS
jgi:hypothetical protein